MVENEKMLEGGKAGGRALRALEGGTFVGAALRIASCRAKTDGGVCERAELPSPAGMIGVTDVVPSGQWINGGYEIGILSIGCVVLCCFLFLFLFFEV